MRRSCELLSFFCIFEIQHNLVFVFEQFCDVVNCFHFSVSLRYNTTNYRTIDENGKLWIAFIFLYLWDTTQLSQAFEPFKPRCELLSFFCIFEIQHNYSETIDAESMVVNCFHFSVSLRYNTTGYVRGANASGLWIAFIFLYLWDTTQQSRQPEIQSCSCELLSFFCIFEIQHNSTQLNSIVVHVVNCFHFSVSLRYNTTLGGYGCRHHLLWIAFIFLYLWDTTQQNIIISSHQRGCELLSFFCIFEIQHNLLTVHNAWLGVVNCFHFSVSLRYNTTTVTWNSIDNQLWIAFIFLYLWDTTQLFDRQWSHHRSCELLSFFCIFEIQHNHFR